MRRRESSVSGVPRVTTSSKRTIWLAVAIGLLAVGGCDGSYAPSDAGFEPRPSPGVRPNPSSPPLALSLAGIELGFGHTCGLESSGRAHCMGDNQYGQHACSQTLLAVDGGITFVQLGLDQRHSCTRSTDGSIYCWGFGEGGQLGDGLRVTSQVPVRAQAAVRFRYLGRGQSSGSLCAIAVDGRAQQETFASLSAGGHRHLRADSVRSINVLGNELVRATGVRAWGSLGE